MSANSPEFEVFLQGWSADALGLKPYAQQLYSQLCAFGDVEFEYKGRPGVSYSLRAIQRNQKSGGGRPLFALLDIIDDEPEARWLSICFYADTLNDPDELGNFVPSGLLGEDAMCFDIDEANAALLEYVALRLSEAREKAGV